MISMAEPNIANERIPEEPKNKKQETIRKPSDVRTALDYSKFIVEQARLSLAQAKDETEKTARRKIVVDAALVTEALTEVLQLTEMPDLAANLLNSRMRSLQSREIPEQAIGLQSARERKIRAYQEALALVAKMGKMDTAEQVQVQQSIDQSGTEYQPPDAQTRNSLLQSADLLTRGIELPQRYFSSKAQSEINEYALDQIRLSFRHIAEEGQGTEQEDRAMALFMLMRAMEHEYSGESNINITRDFHRVRDNKIISQRVKSIFLETAKTLLPNEPKPSTSNIPQILASLPNAFMQLKTILPENEVNVINQRLGEMQTLAHNSNDPSRLRNWIYYTLSHINDCLIRTVAIGIKKKSLDDQDISQLMDVIGNLWQPLYRLQRVADSLEPLAEKQQVEKLRKNISMPDAEAGPEEPQEWIDHQREGTYEQIAEEVRKWLSEGRTPSEYLASLASGMADSQSRGRLSKLLEIVRPEAIEIMLITSDSASAVAGKTIERPVFVVTDQEAYEKLEGIFGVRPGSTHGLHFASTVFKKNSLWGRVGTIICTDNPTTQGHEIRHSIDPLIGGQMMDRKGENRMLSELFAFYPEYVREDVQDWEGILNRVESYAVEHIDSEDEKKIETYSKRLVDAVKKIKSLYEKFGSLKTQRILVQCKTIDQLLAF